MNLLTMFLIQIAILIYSLSSVFSKLASAEVFLSFRYLFFTGMIVACLGVYAILWQQILKRTKLSSAFAFKGLTLVWNIALGYFLFKEGISVKNMIGAFVVLIGIFIVTIGGRENE